MSIYSDKLAYIQVIINYQYSVAQMCTHEDTLAHILGTPYIDDVMKHNELTTNVFANKIFWSLKIPHLNCATQLYP